MNLPPNKRLHRTRDNRCVLSDSCGERIFAIASEGAPVKRQGVDPTNGRRLPISPALTHPRGRSGHCSQLTRAYPALTM
jgi:hypothetical protein